MKPGRVILIPARALFGLFVVLTSFYCLLTFIPFTYIHFLQFKHFTWLTLFVEYHSLLYWISVVLVTITLRGDLRAGRTRLPARSFVALAGICGVAMLIRPLLANLQNDFSSLLWGLVWLIPLIWVAAIDLIGTWSKVRWAAEQERDGIRTFAVCVLSAVFLSLVYFGIAQLRTPSKLSWAEQSATVLWSTAYHVVAFVALFLTISLIRAFGRFFGRPARVEFVLLNLLAVAVFAEVLRNIALSAVSFVGTWAAIFSSAAAFSIVCSVSAFSLRLRADSAEEVQDGVGFALRSLIPERLTGRTGLVVWIVAVPAAAYFLAVKTAVMDWNFLLQKLSVAGVWAATLAGFYVLKPRSKSSRNLTVLVLILSVGCLVAYRALEGSATSVASALKVDKRDLDAALDRYEGYDVSFKLSRQLLSPSVGEVSFYRFLQQNTSISRSVDVAPVDYKLVAELRPTTGERPHIFIIVVDSLRPDYLSPYNNAVKFTPSIESFASEAVVMKNAHTHYGATGLSQPSIWAGGLLLHKQYITPFYPMNALQKLIKIDDYQSYITIDTIVNIILEPSPSITELDAGVQDKSYDLCRSLKELSERIVERKDTSKPIFAYTQPQNIHISVINREGNTVLDGNDYSGFYAPYASRVRRMDACFGEFIQHLKSQNLYDNSIVILTADHGDSLGEGGRWGHAYTIFPEVIRIPLVIHVPPKLQKDLYWNPETSCFSTDITPTLYYLLGHRPVVRNGIFGRPLFTTTREEFSQYLSDSYVLASSYGAVWGILRHNGGSLYIADGVNYSDYYYDLTSDSRGDRVAVTPSIKGDSEALMRAHIQAINDFFSFSPER